MCRFLCFSMLLLWLAAHVRGQDEAAPTKKPAEAKLSPAQLEFFEKQVRPLLARRCYECHSGEAKKLGAGLRLDSRKAWQDGGDSGPPIVPGDTDKSLLVKAVRYTDADLQMPPGGKLPDREIDVLVQWVRMGAPDPRDAAVAHPAAAKAGISEKARAWWAFQPVKDHRPPAVQNGAWAADPIDCFVLARLEAAGFQPAPPADKRTLIRRATFDLIGLPPTPEEINAFLADDSPDAFAKVIERLLASRHYGERWGRHWLDVVRYADTSGCNSDFPMPEAYRYRNWVIESFNRDKAYDQFLREQIAGDLLPHASDEERYQHTIATGYLAISRRFSSLAEEFHLTLDDTIDNFGKALLGLTISCARCHEHKFDPIPQEDYYALYGIFQSTKYAFPGTEIYRHTQDMVPLEPARRVAELRPYLARMTKLDAEILEVYSRMAKLDTGREKNDLRARVNDLQKQRDDLVKGLPAYRKAMAASEGTAANARIHLKGDPEKLGPEVPRGWLKIFGGQKLPANERGSGRLALANWLTDPRNPLTARVLVNRVWQHHFDQGFVRTPDDLGTRSEPPTHPELLDYLTRRFVEGGWSIKSLHWLIMLSRSYQMACVENADYARRDPENRLLWTFNRRRLSAEELRDAMLAVSASLDRSMPGAHPFRPEWEWRYTQHKPFVDDFPTRHRSVYLMQQRIRAQPYLGTFDGADTNSATGLRKISTTPQQALFTLNNRFVHQQAERLAERLGEVELTDRIDRAFRLALGRAARAEEVEEADEYLRQIEPSLQAAGVPTNQLRRAVWVSYLRVLLSSNEFAFVE
jgi:hypothetical protein